MSNRKTLDERIEAAKAEKQQAEARIKELLQQQKAQARKDRNHRLCKRGGQVEKLLPSLAELTEEQFETFVQKTLLTGFAEKILRGLAPTEPADRSGCADTAQGGTDPAKTPAAPERTAPEPAPKTPAATQNLTVGGNDKPAQAPRAAS